MVDEYYTIHIVRRPTMHNTKLSSNLFLFLAAAIWGFAFVAQRIGAQYVGSFTFNGVRFALGSLSLLPLLVYFNKSSKAGSVSHTRRAWPSGILAGIVLFIAASLQQVGVTYTNAGKAAFITGLYIVLVPLLGVFLKHKIRLGTWIGVVVAIVGLFTLSVTERFSIEKGDLLVLIGAFFWAVHILLIDHFTTMNVDALKLSCVQFVTCSILSLAVALGFEKISLHGLLLALIPILYGGICSVGIAYTLQVIGQKHAKPSHAAIILSLEAVFASIGGILILHEQLNFRGYLGCALMLFGMLLSQLGGFDKNSGALTEEILS